MITWVWERRDWPNFKWDEDAVRAAAAGIASTNAAIAKGIDDMPEDARTEAMIDLLVSEAVKTSEIEGEFYSRKDIRSSILKHARRDPRPVEPDNERAAGVARMMVEAQKHFNGSLTKELLWEWQSMIVDKDEDGVPVEKGRWRTSGMHIVNDSGRKKEVVYEAPESGKVPMEMEYFIRWFNDGRGKMDSFIRAGIAHVHFECIHPFADGNGRVGRAIADMALSQGMGRRAPLSLSEAIRERNPSYYGILKKIGSGDLEITEWLTWFAGTVRLAQKRAMETTRWVLHKTQLWDKHSHKFNERQRKVISELYDEGVEGFAGGVRVQEYAKIAECGMDEARRDLMDLNAMGMLKDIVRFGRRRRYNINVPDRHGR